MENTMTSIKTTLTALLCAAAAACNNPQTTAAPAVPASATATTPPTASSTASSSIAAVKSAAINETDFGGDFTLTGSDGKPFTLSSLKGKAVVLAFGFTNCPDVCPTELFTYSEAVGQLGEQGKNTAVVFVSVDPERDTPELIGRYVAQFHPDFIGLTDTPDSKALQSVKQQYRIVSAKSQIKSDKLYNVDHSSGAYLLDKNGKAVMFAPYGIEAPQLAEDLKKVLAM